MWAPYLAAVKQQLSALHILDRFHIRRQLNKAVDEIRRDEARALAQAGLVPRLKKLRWALLKNRKNWTPSERRRMGELEHSGLAAIRAFWLVAAFDHFWRYVSPTWAGKFLDGWCQRVRPSRLKQLKTIAASLTEHREILLNYFRAKKAISGGVIEGLNNKVKVTFRSRMASAPTRLEKSRFFMCLVSYPNRNSSMVSFRQPLLICPQLAKTNRRCSFNTADKSASLQRRATTSALSKSAGTHSANFSAFLASSLELNVSIVRSATMVPRHDSRCSRCIPCAR
jgi:hypothetical protein